MLSIERKSIRIYRSSIKITILQKQQLKLIELQELTRIPDIIKISEQYNFLARKALNTSGYSSLSKKNPEKHKNWSDFEKIYEICNYRSWDTGIYLEAQFKKCIDGKCSFKIPPVKTLHSGQSIKIMQIYMNTIKSKYSEDINLKDKQVLKASSIKQEVIKDIVDSAEIIANVIGQQRDKVQNLAEYKAIKVFQLWSSLSSYYLWSIPWFHKAIEELSDEDKKVLSVRKDFDRINNTKSIQKIITMTVETVEKNLIIPHNIEL